MKLSEMIKVMQHYEDGGLIEYKSRKDTETHWTTVTSPSWDWAYFEYRIREQKRKVTIEKWLCRDKQGEYAVIEASYVDKYELYKKIKLLRSYEVEI